MKKKVIYEHKSLLGSVKTETTFNVKNGLETLNYNESRRVDRMIAYNFLIKARNKELLSSTEIEGIVYFLGINLNKLANLIGVDRSTLTNVIKGKKPSKLLCHTLLDAVERELVFPNYFKAKFEDAIECKLDKHFYELLITKEAA